jgi:hypothetical protein
MIRTFFLVIALSFSLTAFAQARRAGEDFAGIALKGALPTGSFSNQANFGFGISAMDEYVLSDKWSFSADITYLRWGAKQNSIGIENFQMIGFTGSPKYYIDNVYLGCEVGLFYNITQTLGQFASAYRFGLAPTIGYHTGILDIAAEYAIQSDRQWVNLRVGFMLFDFQLN